MISSTLTSITPQLAYSLLHHRPENGHKGDFGHALVIAGKKGMMGAALLASRAALRSGIGKLTIHVPQEAETLFHLGLPEALLDFDELSKEEWQSPVITEGYDAILIGPGIGRSGETQWVLRTQLQMILNQTTTGQPCPLVVDADGLNLIAQDYQLLSLLPKHSILTPHVGEMQRLAKALEMPYQTTDQLLLSAQTMARELQLHLIVKSHETFIFTAEGESFCNCQQGNDGMATAGSGDVLAGIVVALLAQGYTAKEAAAMGVFLHATAGDVAASRLGKHSLLASDIIDTLPQAFLSIE